MFLTPRIGSPSARESRPVNFGAIYRISHNSEQEISQASTKLQEKGIFISRFFQGEDRYLAANEKKGTNRSRAGQDASAVTEIFKLRKSKQGEFTAKLRELILNRLEKGEIKELSEVDNHPALSNQKASTSDSGQNTREARHKTKFPATVYSDNLETMYDSEGGPEW